MDQSFADWDALVAFVRASWSVEAMAEDGEWFERVWQLDGGRTQQVTLARVEYAGDTWVSWAAAIGDDDQVTEAELVEATAGEVGRIIRDDGCCWLEQHVPLALLTPSLFERYSHSFARRADELERDITGSDRD